jgi:hypothetical protein
MDLDAIEARMARTSARPWYRHGANIDDAGGNRIFDGRDGDAEVRQQADRDAEMVAHAPTDVAELIDEVRRLRTELHAREQGNVHGSHMPSNYAASFDED